MVRSLLQIIGFAVFLHITVADQQCDPDLGCFELGKPWRTPLRVIPAPQNKLEVGTSFTLYRKGDKTGKVVPLYPKIRLDELGFDFKKPSVFLVHGFQSSKEVQWMVDLRTAYLEKKDVNLFMTDWAKGAAASPLYLQAVSNARVVGREISRLIRNIVDNGGKAEEAHCVGHSLGAHCCAYVGKNLTTLGLITGLDPARPAFEGFSKEVRLISKDAHFVDVLHTDADPAGFGMTIPCGHVDFYFNGKNNQPGCENAGNTAQTAADVAYGTLSCSHSRAPTYYIEAIKGPCVFWGWAWTPTAGSVISLEDSAGPKKCDVNTCTAVGLKTSKFPFRGTAYVKTAGTPPYCRRFPGKISKELKHILKHK